MQTINDIVQPRDTYWVDADDTIRQTVHYLCERKTGAVAVKDGDHVAGIFSERDLMHRVVNAGLDPETTTVREVMSDRLIFIDADAEIHLAKSKMFQNGVRHLMVLGKGGVFRGLVSMRDLIEADVNDSAELIHKLNDTYYESAYKAKLTVSSNRFVVQPYTPTA